MLSIRLDEALEERLGRLAHATGRTKTYYAKEAITRYLEDMEDTYLALQRLETPGKRYSMAEVEAAFGLGD